MKLADSFARWWHVQDVMVKFSLIVIFSSVVLVSTIPLTMVIDTIKEKEAHRAECTDPPSACMTRSVRDLIENMKTR